MVILYYENTVSESLLSTSQSEIALPSSGSWLPSRPSSTRRWAERIQRIFSNSKYAKKRDISSEKRDGAEKARVYARKR